MKFTQTVQPKLLPPSQDVRSRWNHPEHANAQSHQKAFEACAAMHAIEYTRRAQKNDALVFPIRLGTWNLERCYYPQASANIVSDCQVLLLSEMDAGMARTGQTHTAMAIAEQLDMHASYGVEFLELGLGSPIERNFCKDDENTLGFHGNAVLASTPLHDLILWRFSEDGDHWYRPESPELRIGGRFALGSKLNTQDGDLFVVSVHLEYFHSPRQKENTIKNLLAAIELWCGDKPVVIGGDLNTFEAVNNLDEEPLFAAAQSVGYIVHGASSGVNTTHPSAISPRAKNWRLDWIMTRHLQVNSVQIRSAITKDAVLSDHDAVVIEIIGRNN